MIVFPRYQLRPRYKGEERVYDLLAKVTEEYGFAVHSVNLPEHEYKRWGEADFVIVSQAGVTLLEIKGGSVSLAGREWRYENARGQAIISTEGPARQAISAAIALEKLLTTHLRKRICCRWGVVFPLCNFRRSVAELPPSRLANNLVCDDIETFQDWLRNLPFGPYKSNDFVLNNEDIDRIREVLMPEFSATTSLGLAVKSTQEAVIRLTEQQFAILESLESNSRLCISGGAGTGKTELITLCARAEKAAGRTPAIVTTGKPLSAALRSRMMAYGIPVVSDSLPNGTDTLLVDEGQDYLQPDRMESLFRQLPGGLPGGRWRWFMDPNLQFMGVSPSPACFQDLASHSVNVSLTRNVRSTREIISSIKVFLDADVGISQIDGFGIKVGFHSVADTEEEVAATQRLIDNMIEEGVQPSEIAVLGACGVSGPTCRQLLKQMPGRFQALSAEGRIQSSVHGMACGISDFRGLEARVVLLVDLHLLPIDRRGESLLYIGMSRASASLQLLVQPVFDDFLKVLLKNSFERK